jgi:hypothetical protein
MVDLREVAPVLSGAAQGNQVTLTATFLASLYLGAQYAVGEIGFYINGPPGTGTLFAVVSSPTLASPLRGGAITTNYTPTFSIALTGVPAGSVNVTFDPGAGAALVALNAHAAAANPHANYLLKAGGTMTGPLELAANAVSAMQAVPLQQLTAAFGGNFLDSGLFSLPSGHIVKWGQSSTAIVGTNATEGLGTVAFPAVFPTACLWAIAVPWDQAASPSGLDDAGLEMKDWTASGFTVRTKYSGGGGNNIVRGLVYLAIGH